MLSHRLMLLPCHIFKIPEFSVLSAFKHVFFQFLPLERSGNADAMGVVLRMRSAKASELHSQNRSQQHTFHTMHDADLHLVSALSKAQSVEG
jgi:hypothetical protein